jgi:hypothetical protein
MATTPKITTISNYVLNTTLPLISAGGNYALTVKTISKDYMAPNDVNISQMPAAFILTDGPNLWTPLTANEYSTGNAPQDITLGYVLRVIGYVNVPDPGDAQKTGVLTDKMNQFISDIVIAMNSDRSLGGNVDAVTLLGTDTSLEFWELNIGVVEVWFSLKYDILPSAGRA